MVEHCNEGIDIVRLFPSNEIVYLFHNRISPAGGLFSEKRTERYKLSSKVADNLVNRPVSGFNVTCKPIYGADKSG
jgi:hypothetical protein